MKKSGEKICKVSDEVGKVLGLTFKNEEYRLDGWGEVDNWAETEFGTLVLLECEFSQKHPNTNVTKLWPFLVERHDIRVFLLHYFDQLNKASKNRLKLCEYFGKRMEEEFPGRFGYVKINCSSKAIKTELASICDDFISFDNQSRQSSKTTKSL